MSGVEFIVGVVLASVPVAVQMFEQYAKFSATISNFRRYSTEIVKLQSKVGAQKTIFRNNAANLLSAITDDPETIHSWLSATRTGNDTAVADPDRWELAAVYRDRIDILEESFQSCDKTVIQIVAALDIIKDEVSGLARALERTDDSGEMNTRDWLRHFRVRVRLALRNSGLSKTIDELRNFNNDFHIMVGQISKSLDEIKKRIGPNTTAGESHPITMKRAMGNLNLAERYRQIRLASKILHQTLAINWRCGAHQKHSASVSCVESHTLVEGDSVRFDVGISARDGTMGLPTVVPSRPEALWVEVEYSDGAQVHQGQMRIHSSTMEPDALDRITLTLSQYVGTSVRPDSPAKRVRFDDLGTSTTTQFAAHQGGVGSATSPEQMTRLPVVVLGQNQAVDLLQVRDFCEHFRHACLNQANLQQQRRCLGYLGDPCRQRFYLARPDRRLTGEARSLESILSWISESSFTKMLPLPLTLHIAGLLATSILQFHSTPWLPTTWRIQDVKFFSAGDPSEGQEIRLSCPYFHADLSKPLEASEAASLMGRQNEILFRFGIVLLELGFARPWGFLKEMGSSKLPADMQSEYHIVEKLCALLTTQMGAGYPQIIRRCIGCDFGLRQPQISLESEDLQVGFLTDVILVLQSMEQGLRACS